jgi:hypothetical protein
VSNLPFTYLGLPLSVKKLSKGMLQAVLDKLAQKLALWKAKLLSKDGRVAFVQVVLTASIIYQLMALDVEPWFLKAVDKLRRGFLWAGKADTRGGSCLVAWDAVCQPKHLGGLGFHNLKWLNAALRARWIWLQKTDPSKPWAGLHFNVMPAATAIFNASTTVAIGDGARTLFWEDPWLDGLTVDAVAPAVLSLVRPSIAKSRTVQTGVEGMAWVRDISGELTVDATVQYLALWSAVQAVQTNGGDDRFVWKWCANGQFSTRTAYRAFFHGRIALPGAAQVWNAFAPFKVKFHAWLSLRNRCWTADRLARRGLPSHVICPLCTSADETLDHLSLRCPYAYSVWAGVFLRLDIRVPLPTPQATLPAWWPASAAAMTRQDARAFNSLVMLVLRTIWLERNARVFDAKSTPSALVIDGVVGEWNLWSTSRLGGSWRDLE